MKTESSSFSIILETANLSVAELDGLSRSLGSLAKQSVSLNRAEEVLLMNSGTVKKEMLEKICRPYPWLKIREIESGATYYKAKMEGVPLTTADIIVFCDSDCIYEPNWLEQLLMPFGDNKQIEIVAGDTTTPILGPYGVAMALTYIFPPPLSERSQLSETLFYFCNNVAFRRQVLEKYPIPCDLPVYRGNCSVHAHSLRQRGHVIWKQPKARASHALPNGLGHFFWRFLYLGLDSAALFRIQPRFLRHPSQTTGIGFKDLRHYFFIQIGKFEEFIKRAKIVLKEDKRRIFYLPVAIPIALAAMLLYGAGGVLGIVRPPIKSYE